MAVPRLSAGMAAEGLATEGLATEGLATEGLATEGLATEGLGIGVVVPVKEGDKRRDSASKLMNKPQNKTCPFCVSSTKNIDYKDAETLKRFTSSFGKIAPKKRSGVCSWHQRKLANAIKKARVAGLLPFLIQ